MGGPEKRSGSKRRGEKGRRSGIDTRSDEEKRLCVPKTSSGYDFGFAH
jgi:hypothetical protein